MHLVLIGWILEYSSRVREVAAYCVDSILMMADVVSWGRLMIKALLCVWRQCGASPRGPRSRRHIYGLCFRKKIR